MIGRATRGGLLALIALVSLFAWNPAAAQAPPAPSISLTGGDYPDEIKVNWTWSDGGTGCQVDDYYVEYKKSTVSTWNTSVLDHGANDADSGIYSVDSSFGSSTSISSNFTIGPRAKGAYHGDGEVGVTLADVNYDVRMYVYSDTCGWSSNSSVATGEPTEDVVPAFASGTTIANLTLTQNSAMTAVTLPAATGGNRSVYYSISPDLPDGLSASQSTRVLSGTPTGTQSETTYTYKASDTDYNTAADDAVTLTFTITIEAEPDTAPDFGSNTIANLSLTQNSAMTAVTLPEATGGNGTLSYSLSPAPPAGLSFNTSTRVLSGTPTGTSASATYTYTVSDGDDNTADTDKDTITFTIVVAAEDTAPSFGSSTIANQSLTQNSAMTSLTLPAATGGNGTLSYAITPALPTGLTFTASTRVLSGTPTGTSASATYTYTVSDGDDNTADTDKDTITFTITVSAADDDDTPPGRRHDAADRVRLQSRQRRRYQGGAWQHHRGLQRTGVQRHQRHSVHRRDREEPHHLEARQRLGRGYRLQRDRGGERGMRPTGASTSTRPPPSPTATCTWRWATATSTPPATRARARAPPSQWTPLRRPCPASVPPTARLPVRRASASP